VRGGAEGFGGAGVGEAVRLGVCRGRRVQPLATRVGQRGCHPSSIGVVPPTD